MLIDIKFNTIFASIKAGFDQLKETGAEARKSVRKRSILETLFALLSILRIFLYPSSL